MDEKRQRPSEELHEVHEMQRRLGGGMEELGEALAALASSAKALSTLQKIVLPLCVLLSSAAFAWSWRTEGRVLTHSSEISHLQANVVTGEQLERLRGDLMSRDNPQLGLVLQELRAMSERLVRVETRLDRRADQEAGD